MSAPKSLPKGQLTGNSGLFHTARELSRRGWHVVLTVRNARGSDMFATNNDESVVHTIQSKALSRRSDVPLGNNIANLRSSWWIVTMNANSSEPTCYILTLDEVKTAAGCDIKEGKRSYWLPYKKFACKHFKERWDRLGDPSAPETPALVMAATVSQKSLDRAFAEAFDANGGNKPRGICRALRAVAKDWNGGREDFLVAAEQLGLNVNNARVEWNNGRKPSLSGE